MDLGIVPLEQLPEDLITVLLQSLYDISKTSLIVFAYINKSCHQKTSKFAIKYHIKRPLKSRDVALEGFLNVLKWFQFVVDPFDFFTCANAALNGHLDILKWARLMGYSWNWKTCAFAAQNGHIDILIWAKSNGCQCDHKTCMYAAEYGQLAVLEWAISQGCKMDSDICAFA